MTKGQIIKANKKHGAIFSPKYRAFQILQNQIEDVVQKSTSIWKVIYGLKIGEEDPSKGKDDEEEEEKEEKQDEEEEKEKEKKR